MVSSEKLRSPPSWPVSQRSSSDSVLSSKMLCAFAPGEFEVLPFISIITCALLIFGAKCNRKTARRAARRALNRDNGLRVSAERLSIKNQIGFDALPYLARIARRALHASALTRA